jgi:plastocyanin
MQKIIALVVLIVLIGGGWWYYTTNMSAPTTQVPTAEEVTSGMPVPNTPDTVVVREFTVTGSSFAFAPSTMTVKKGEKVRVTFKNSGGKHDWVLDEFTGARTKVLDAGAQEVIEFTADKVGTFEYYCSVGQHRAAGMKGVLTVTE